MNNIVISLILLVLIGSMIFPIIASAKKESFNQYAIEQPTSYFEKILKSHVVDVESSSDLVSSKNPPILNKINSYIWNKRVEIANCCCWQIVVSTCCRWKRSSIQVGNLYVNIATQPYWRPVWKQSQCEDEAVLTELKITFCTQCVEQFGE